MKKRGAQKGSSQRKPAVKKGITRTRELPYYNENAALEKETVLRRKKRG